MTPDKRIPCELDETHAKSWGFFRLAHYSPATRSGSTPERCVTHDISGEATLDQMLEAFGDFLVACGYSLDGEVVIEEARDADR